MSAAPQPPAPAPRWYERWADVAMSLALGVMAAAVFVNVVLRYGFGSGVNASEELSRLLFVWMVFIGATAAYPRGHHMAFNSLLVVLQRRGHHVSLRVLTGAIHALVATACALVGWGAWQQVVVGMDSTSVVIGYNAALLPLPALLSSVAIGVMALWNLVRGKPVEAGHEVDVE